MIAICNFTSTFFINFACCKPVVKQTSGNQMIEDTAMGIHFCQLQSAESGNHMIVGYCYSHQCKDWLQSYFLHHRNFK